MVYLGGFLGVIVLLPRWRALWPKTVFLLVGTLAIVGAYLLYHRLTVAHVGAIVEVNRNLIWEMWLKMTPSTRWSPPLNDGFIVNNFHLMYHTVNALVLLTMPIAFALFFRTRLLAFVWASVFAYFIIIGIPIVSVWYLLATYFDMLSAPVRNVMFFIYIMTGALVYVMAALAARVRPLAIGLVALVGLAWLVPGATDRLRAGMTEGPGFLFMAGLAGSAIGLGLGLTRWGQAWGDALKRPAGSVRFGLCVGVLLISLGVFLYQPASALAVWKTPVVSNVAEAIQRAAIPSYPADYVVVGTDKRLQDKGSSDVPPYDFVRWVSRNVPVDAVVAANLFNGNIITTFIPQRALAWPIGYYDPVNYCINFAHYCRAVNRSAERYGVQPFFNEQETREERIAFLTEYEISHVIVDPAVAAMMGPVLARHPDLFTRVYSSADWHVFAVLEQ